MSAENLTVRERVLLHLNRFPGIGPEEIYNVPFDLTQDGVATVAGISRAHACLILKKMEADGKAEHWLAHAKGSGPKRFVYRLLPDGKAEAEKLKEAAEKSGIIIEAMLDIKRCEPSVMWDSLSEKDADALGKACVFRVPIPRNTLPETSTGVIPADFGGKIIIADKVRENYLAAADQSKIKEWNSFAADWWMDHDDEPERLYHLMKAGRNTDACKVIIKNGYEFATFPTEDLLKTMKQIEIPPKYREAVATIAGSVAVALCNCDEALRYAEIVKDYDKTDSDLLHAFVMNQTGQSEAAFKIASKIFNEKKTAKSALAAATALIGMKKISEAEKYLKEAYDIVKNDADATMMGEILFLYAAVEYNLDHKDEAVKSLRKAEKYIKAPLRIELMETTAKRIVAGEENIKFI